MQVQWRKSVNFCSAYRKFRNGKGFTKGRAICKLRNAVFKTDETSISAFEISYQHKEINKFLKAKVSKHSQSRCGEMKAWYTRIENSKSTYCSRSKSPYLTKKDTEMFLTQSLLFKDENLCGKSRSLSCDVVGVMQGFSTIMEEDPEYSFLAFTPVISGSMREETKTFCPNEFDLTLAIKSTTGLEIENKVTSRSLVKVNDTADRRWLGLCIKNSNVLCPTKLKHKFNMAMKKCVRTKAATHHISSFSFSEYSIQEKDKIPCMHFLYRSSSFKDLLISMDFVIGLAHPNYKIRYELPVQNEDETKACKFYVIPKVSERKLLNSENAYFLVSYADIESRFVNCVPDHVKTGFIFAKAARNAKLCSLPRVLSDRIIEPIHIDEFITTYMLKTCLMIAMTNTDVNHYSISNCDLLNRSTSHGCAYILYVLLHSIMIQEGRLPFFFDKSIDLFQCRHNFDLDYDDKLGCCLKRALIVAFCKGIMQSLEQLVPNAGYLKECVLDKFYEFYDSDDSFSSDI